MRSTPVPRGAVALLLALAAGCGTPDGSAAPTPVTPTPPTTTAASTTATSTTTTAPPASSTPAFPADTSDQVGEAAGASEQVSGVTVTARDGYDEVVLEVPGGPGAVPGFRVGYVDAAVGEPSAQPVAVEGAAVLQVFVTGVSTAPADGAIPTGVLAGAGGVVTQVVGSSSFEGAQQLFVGLDAERPFRVRATADPGRVVVQVLST